MKKPAEKSADSPPQSPRAQPTPDGHYVVIDGRKWRATNPNLPEEVRQGLVNELMSARRAVGAARKSGDSEAEKAARARVNAAKIGLGERGPKWWETPDAPNADASADADATTPNSKA